VVSLIKSNDEESGQEGEADSNENNSGQKAGKAEQKERKKKEKKEKRKEVRVEVTPAVAPKEKNIQVATRLVEAKKPVQNNREKNEQHSLTISEAFADDDVIEEFRAEKVRLFSLI